MATEGRLNGRFNVMHKGPEATRASPSGCSFHCVCLTQKAAIDFFFSISKYILFILYFPFIKAMKRDLLQHRRELHLLLTSLYAGRFVRKIVAFVRLQALLALLSLDSRVRVMNASPQMLFKKPKCGYLGLFCVCL